MRFLPVICYGAAFAAAVQAPRKQQQSSLVPKALRAPMTGLMGMLAANTAAATENPGHSTAQSHLIDMVQDTNLMRDEFHAFAKKYERPYVMVEEASSSSSESPMTDVTRRVTISPAQGQEQVYEQKYQAFKDNVHKAIKMNTESGGKTTFGITKFSDMSKDEFKEHTKCMIPNMKKGDSSTIPKWQGESKFLNSNKDYTKDWRDEGVITDVKDQQQCGSCWAFSTVETIESSVKQQFGDDYIGSPQQLVSCDHHGDMGCNGGLPTNAYKYLEKAPLDTEKYYPYKSGDGRSRKCHAKSKKHGVYEVDSFQTVASGAGDEDAMKKFVGTEGPLSIGVDATQWQLYQGGVMSAEQCDGFQMDHAVQVVALKDGHKGYWTVRNSWNTDWGENGYIRLEAGANACLIAEDATTAKVKKYSPTEDVEMGGSEITV